MKYHSEGINKNKKIRRERNKPLPIKLMQVYIPTQFGHTGECLSDRCDCIIGKMKRDSKRS